MAAKRGPKTTTKKTTGGAKKARMTKELSAHLCPLIDGDYSNLYPTVRSKSSSANTDASWDIVTSTFNRDKGTSFTRKEIYNHASYMKKCAKERLSALLRDPDADRDADTNALLIPADDLWLTMWVKTPGFQETINAIATNPTAIQEQKNLEKESDSEEEPAHADTSMPLYISSDEEIASDKTLPACELTAKKLKDLQGEVLQLQQRYLPIIAGGMRRMEEVAESIIYTSEILVEAAESTKRAAEAQERGGLAHERASNAMNFYYESLYRRDFGVPMPQPGDAPQDMQ